MLRGRERGRERQRRRDDDDYKNPLFIHLLSAVMRADVMAIAKEEEIRLIIQTQRHCLLGTFTGVVNFLFS
jgi:hypothetical protein